MHKRVPDHLLGELVRDDNDGGENRDKKPGRRATFLLRVRAHEDSNRYGRTSDGPKGR